VGCVPRFVVVKGTFGLGLVETFEHALTALPAEREFADIEIVAHRARRHGRTTELTLIVDRPSGVDLQACERIARRLNAELDGETEPYTLEVESAGLDRPLLHAGDYERFRGQPVRVVTSLPVGGAKTHRGTLAGVRGTAVVVQQPTGELPLPIEMIKSANLEFDPRADLRREKRERKERRCL
jgi:ribosome maturation factor RimP